MSHLTPEQLKQLRAALEEKRAKLLDYNLSVDTSDPTNDPDRDMHNESGEEALENYEMLESESLENASSAMVEEIEAALARIDAGTYGHDQETGEPIPFARLKLYPAARTNVKE